MWTIVFIATIISYITFGTLYLFLDEFTPLGCMNTGIILQNMCLIILIGIIGVLFGIIILKKIIYKLRIIKHVSCIANQKNIYLCLFIISSSIVLFIYSMFLYGGYIEFIKSNYQPVIYGKYQNEVKDSLIATSSILACYSLFLVLAINRNINAKIFIIASAAIINISVFLEGRREYIILIILTFILTNVNTLSQFIKKKTRLIAILFFGFVISGIGLVLRGDITDNENELIINGVKSTLYESHFTIATLANEVQIHSIDRVPHEGILGLFNPIFYIIPRFMFSILNLNKDELFQNNDIGLYRDLGGSFIFSSGFHYFGLVGVFLHAIVLGILISHFNSMYNKTYNSIYALLASCAIFVGVRKDIMFSIKYISIYFLCIMIFKPIYKTFLLAFRNK